MKKQLFTAVLALSVFAIAPTDAAATPVLIDFESYSVGQVLAANTDLGGVYFDQNIRVWGANQFPPFATGNVALNHDNFADDFSGGFFSAVSSFSIAVGDECCDLDSAILSVFDAGHVLLGSASFSNVASGTVLSVSAAGIRFFSVDQTGLVVFDNLTFDTAAAAVPEPTTLVLVGLGLTGVAVARRRKHSA